MAVMISHDGTSDSDGEDDTENRRGPCVAVDDKELVFHDPNNLATTTDMDVVPWDEAIDDGARRCSGCFPQVGYTEQFVKRMKRKLRRRE